jgi:hypothetical protein
MTAAFAIRVTDALTNDPATPSTRRQHRAQPLTPAMRSSNAVTRCSLDYLQQWGDVSNAAFVCAIAPEDLDQVNHRLASMIKSTTTPCVFYPPAVAAGHGSLFTAKLTGDPTSPLGRILSQELGPLWRWENGVAFVRDADRIVMPLELVSQEWCWGPSSGTVDCCPCEHVDQILWPCGPSGRRTWVSLWSVEGLVELLHERCAAFCRDG